MKLLQPTLSLLAAVAFTLTARANPLTLNLDTSLLTGGNYYIDFQLNDGNGVGDGNNTAVISSFDFGGGAATGTATHFGGASGDLFTAVSLIDNDPFTEFFQEFQAGSYLNFTVLLSNNPNGAIPDFFGFALLDENLMNLATYSLGSDQLLTVEINGGALAYQTYGSVGGIPAPTVGASVPDGGRTLVLLATALAAIVAARRQLRRHQPVT
jgi:hypothetical protein